MIKHFERSLLIFCTILIVGLSARWVCSDNLVEVTPSQDGVSKAICCNTESNMVALGAQNQTCSLASNQKQEEKSSETKKTVPLSVSDCVLASVNDHQILASRCGKNGMLFSGFKPVGLEEVISFYALLDKAKKMDFFNVSQYKIEEYRKAVLEALGLNGKTPAEIDRELKDRFGIDDQILRDEIDQRMRVHALVETFVNSRSTTIYKGAIEEYCNANPVYTTDKFVVAMSDDMEFEKYTQLRDKYPSDQDFSKVLGIAEEALEITIDAKDASPALVKVLSEMEPGSISSAVEKASGKVFVVKLISMAPSRPKSVQERSFEVEQLLSVEARSKLYEQLVKDARRECAIKYYNYDQKSN